MTTMEIKNDNLFFTTKIANYIEKQVETLQRKSNKIFNWHKSGKLEIIQSKRKGNRAYAYDRQKRLDKFVREMHIRADETGGTIIFMSLTIQYNPKSYTSIEKTWEIQRKTIPHLIRWLHRHGFSLYYYVLEASEKGGCHVHLVILHDEPLEGIAEKTDKIGEIKVYLADKTFEKLIKTAWRRLNEKHGGKVVFKYNDIQIVDTLGGHLSAYVSKNSGGKDGHIEDAWKRYKRNWSNEGDEEELKHDLKKIYTFHFSSKSGIRLWGFSKPERDERDDGEEQEDTPDLIVDRVIMTNADRRGIFKNQSGEIDKNSEAYKYAKELRDKRNNKSKQTSPSTRGNDEINKTKTINNTINISHAMAYFGPLRGNKFPLNKRRLKRHMTKNARLTGINSLRLGNLSKNPAAGRG